MDIIPKFCSFPSLDRLLRVISGTEQGRTDPHTRRARRDGQLEIPAHAHRQFPTIRTAAAEAPGSTRIARLLTLAAVALAVFLVVFSPLRSWMDQQQQARSLAAQIAQVKAQNAELEAEIKRYQDPEYISRQARERLGYVKPGEITYVVVDPPGAKKPQLTSGWTDKDTNDLPWFRQIVAGLEVAGAAPAPETTPGADGTTSAPGAKTTEPPASPGKTNPEPAPKSSNAPTHN